MSLKIHCTNVVPNASIWQYTVVSTLQVCRKSSTEIEFGQSGWLARRRGSEERHWKRDPLAFAILGLRKLEPVRARLPLGADSSRYEI
jgi:hypothetical protein